MALGALHESRVSSDQLTIIPVQEVAHQGAHFAKRCTPFSALISNPLDESSLPAFSNPGCRSITPINIERCPDVTST